MVPETLPVGPAGASAAGRESDGGGVVAGGAALAEVLGFFERGVGFAGGEGEAEGGGEEDAVGGHKGLLLVGCGWGSGWAHSSR